MFKIKTKVSRTVIVILVLLLSVVFYALSVRPTGRMPWHQQVVAAILMPLQKSFTFMGRGVAGVWRHYFELVGISKENDRLKKIIAAQKYELNRLAEVESENTRLRRLLSFKERHLLNTIGAEVVSNDPRGDFRAVTVNKGSVDGVEVDMPVVSAEGLVGRVVDVSGKSSRILLITDPNMSVDVVVQRSRARALMAGETVVVGLSRHFYLSRLEYLSRKSDILDGDILVTSGLDRMYPPEIPIGVVANLELDSHGVFKGAEVIPFSDFSNLEEVLIIR